MFRRCGVEIRAHLVSAGCLNCGLLVLVWKPSYVSTFVFLCFAIESGARFGVLPVASFIIGSFVYYCYCCCAIIIYSIVACY